MKKLEDLFDIKYGINMELNVCEITKDKDGINFVARTAENNGVVAKVKPIEGKKPQPAGVLTCASGGSVLSTFVQTEPFYSGRDLYVLTPKNDMRLEEKLFYCHCIKMNAYRYRYGRQANKTLKDIELPELPDWLKSYTIDYSRIETKIEKKELPLNISMWKYCSLTSLFSVERGTRLTKENRIPGNISLVTAGETNEGVSAYILNDEMMLYSNVLTIDMFCNCFYHDYEFACDDNILVLFPKFKYNKYVLIFVATVINFDKYRYAYGRQYRQKNFREHKIKLPVDKNENPDWQFMENYMRSMPYSDRI